MVMQSTGQELSQRAPQAMHFPSRRRALPRGFFIGFVASVMDDPLKIPACFPECNLFAF
jgi:hypothetical protein